MWCVSMQCLFVQQAPVALIYPGKIEYSDDALVSVQAIILSEALTI